MQARRPTEARETGNLRALALRTHVYILTLCLVSTSCSVQTPSTGTGQVDGAPAVSPTVLRQLRNLPNPRVVPLPVGQRGNSPTYTVWGKSYQVMPSAQGYVEEGGASWYGTKFHGRQTSSGERFDMFALTAAHKSLPIPVFARVTNLANGRSTIVRVNDRGPFHGDRIIDLSYAAAVKLGFARQGTTRVRVEALTESEPQQYLFAGSFDTVSAGRRAQTEVVEATGVSATLVRYTDTEKLQLRIGPVESDTKLEQLRALVTVLGLGLPEIRLLHGQQ